MYRVFALASAGLDEVTWLVLSVLVLLVTDEKHRRARCIIVSNAIVVDLTYIASMVVPGRRAMWPIIAFSSQLVLILCSTVFVRLLDTGFLMYTSVLVSYAACLVLAILGGDHFRAEEVICATAIGAGIGAGGAVLTNWCLKHVKPTLDANQAEKYI